MAEQDSTPKAAARVSASCPLGNAAFVCYVFLVLANIEIPDKLNSHIVRLTKVP
jgi:hypothetical protein